MKDRRQLEAFFAQADDVLSEWTGSEDSMNTQRPDDEWGELSEEDLAALAMMRDQAVKAAAALKGMAEAFQRMSEGCTPTGFWVGILMSRDREAE